MTTAEGFAHIDQLLAIFGKQNRGTLTLEAGQPARIVGAGGTSQDVSGRVLSRQEILAIVGPIVPEHARRQIPKEPSVSFDYLAPALGPFKLTIARDSERLIVTIVSEQAGPEPASGPPPVVAAQPLAPARVQADVPPAPPAPVVASGPPIDRLFRVMAAAGASDLHLSAARCRRSFARTAEMKLGPRPSRCSTPESIAAAALRDHAGDEPRAVRAQTATPTSPTRSPGSRASASTSSGTATGPAPSSASIPSEDPDRRAARPPAERSSTSARSRRASCSSPARPAPASRRRSRR